MLGTFTTVVVAIVTKLGRESVERATMLTCDKSLDHLPGKEVEGFVSCDILAKHD